MYIYICMSMCVCLFVFDWHKLCSEQFTQAKSRRSIKIQPSCLSSLLRLVTESFFDSAGVSVLLFVLPFVRLFYMLLKSNQNTLTHTREHTQSFRICFATRYKYTHTHTHIHIHIMRSLFTKMLCIPYQWQ